MDISRPMAHRYVFLLALALLAVAGIFGQSILSRTSASADKPLGKGPVVVELFTSEGCSSCPPADALLRRLEAQSSLHGTEVIVLGWHVDYWDRLGWKDRFSSAEFTLRQQQYADAFASDQVYTPQMVVDGQTEFVGSDEGKARTAIDQASRLAKAAVSLSVKNITPQRIQLQADIRDLPASRGGVRVWLLLTEKNLQSDVRAGENQGNTLKHAAVVRLMKQAGSVPAGQAYHQASEIELDKQWKVQDLRVILLLQDERDRRIVGAASIPLR